MNQHICYIADITEVQPTKQCVLQNLISFMCMCMSTVHFSIKYIETTDESIQSAGDIFTC